ncbi:MAG: FGGY-family carbohydrate kinase [Candidatus Bathyarchaeia archaeon]
MKGLVINLGFRSIRAIVFDSDGKVIASSSRKVETFLSSEYVEQDPVEWWGKGSECLREVIDKAGDIDFITVTASAACVTPVDEEANPTMRTILVSDKRADKEASHISGLKSFKRLGYEASAYYTIPRILWIKRNRPEVYEKTFKFLSPNDFFIAKLTGSFAIDELNATKYYTVGGEYPGELLRDLEIDVGKLPEIKPIGYTIKVSDEFAEAFHLNRDVPVVVTTYDAICAFFGSGVRDEGDACDISGTVTSVRVLTRRDIRPGESRIFQLRYKDWNIVGGSNNLGGGLIEWLLNNFYTGHTYDDLEKLSDISAAASGLIFLPYLMGERAPLWDDKVRGCLLGIERFHSKDDMARAVLESTGFVLRSLIEAIEENGIQVNRIYASGGLARIDLINQIKADITGKRIYRLKEAESTALGAYCLARGALEPGFDASKFFKVEREYLPREGCRKVYEEAYKLFKMAYRDLKRFHDERSKSLVSREDLREVHL